MDRKTIGLLLVIIGLALFFVSLIYILPIPGLYLPSLFIMFLAVVLIGIGAAFARGVDSSLDVPSDECYYCQGTGKIKSGEEFDTCPRCGGSGLARPDDTD
jgi:membrane protein implicated in regulation of membrane protease activity